MRGLPYPSLTGDARRFGDALRSADAAEAERVIDEIVAAGMCPAEVHVQVIGSAMVWIGSLWAAGMVTVADEHIATAICHTVLLRLIGPRHAPARSRERILLAGTEGQHHVLGLRMIADTLEAAGFHVLYLGADVPVDSLRHSVVQHRPAVAGLTFGINTGVELLAESIDAIHTASPATKVVLGGQAVPAGLIDAGYPRIANSTTAARDIEHVLHSPPATDPDLIKLLIPAHRASTASRAPLPTDLLSQAVERIADTARSYIHATE